MNAPLQIVVLMPIRDDWTSAAELLRRLDRTLAPCGCTLDVYLVDDGSDRAADPRAFPGAYSAVRSIHALRLRRNLGHQRAIAIGLAHVAQEVPCDAVLVMDADGEDTADGALRLVEAFAQQGGRQAIFAQRTRRSESLVFRVFYRLYRALHRVLTGVSVRVGNFSILPQKYLATLVVSSDLWNHYAAAVFRSRLGFAMIPIPRGERIAGVSKMTFVSMATHGLSAMSVFADVIGVRTLLAALAGSLVAGLGIASAAGVELFTAIAIPGWAMGALGVLAVVMVQIIAIAASFILFTLSQRGSLGFIPSRDHTLFLADTTRIYGRE
jgi:hypothetical protein